MIETRPMRRTLPFLGALTLLAASCGPGDVQVTSVAREDLGFILQVVDASGDAGAGMDMAGDEAGNPHVSYFVFDPPPEPGQPPVGIQLGVPLRPSVMHAHLTDGLWTRGPLAEEAKISANEDETAIDLDPDGVHHVAWTEGDQLLYATNEGGSFSEPLKVTTGSITGLSIAASDDGTPWIAFYDELSDAEGPVALVRVAHPDGEDWVVETAAEADPPAPATTDVGGARDQVLVAYGDAGGTMLARGDTDSDTPWASEVADPDGGYGVSMSVDGDATPHLAYYTSNGEVRHAHSVEGSPWEITPEVALAGDAPTKGWSTSIDVDENGTHHIAYTQADGIGYRSNADGEFAGREFDSIANAVDPEVVAGPEGIVHVAWYDTRDLTLTLASLSKDEPLLAAPPPEDTAPPPPPTTEPTGPPPCEPDGTELTLTAPPGADTDGWAEDCLAAPAGEAFTVAVDNQDAVPHNLGIYTAAGGDPFFQGDIVNGGESVDYEADAIPDPGQYYFQCDLHPTTMTGTFVVA